MSLVHQDVALSRSLAERSGTPVAARAGADDLELLGERIAMLSAQLQAATHRLLVLVREFDERGGWKLSHPSCAHWLSWRTGLDLGAAREKVRVARALRELPLLSEALGSGVISYSKVRALTRIATPASEAELLAIAEKSSAADVEEMVRKRRRVDRAEEAKRDGLRRDSRSLVTYAGDDGMFVVYGRLEPETGAILLRALDAAAERLYEQARLEQDGTADLPPRDRRYADAIGLVAEAALAGSLDPGTRGDRFLVTVHVDAPVLQCAEPDEPVAGDAMLEDGIDVSAETARRLTCDSPIVTMAHDVDGNIVGVGRKTRLVPPALRRAVEARDRTCRFPGCAVRLGNVHHVKHWADGGATRLDNLILLCRRHHATVHEGGFRVEMDSTGRARFYEPNGREMLHAPPPPAEVGDIDAWLAELQVCMDGFSTSEPSDGTEGVDPSVGAHVAGSETVAPDAPRASTLGAEAAGAAASGTDVTGTDPAGAAASGTDVTGTDPAGAAASGTDVAASTFPRKPGEDCAPGPLARKRGITEELPVGDVSAETRDA